MSVLRLALIYFMYLNVALSFICLPWILANLFDDLHHMSNLPWPNRNIPVLIAAPLIPIGLLFMLIASSEVINMSYAIYLPPMLFVHLLSALLQTASILLTSSLLTASIRDIFKYSYV